MGEEGYGEGYRYDHDEPECLFPPRTIFPEKMGRKQFYDPPERGFERDIRKRLDWWPNCGATATAAESRRDERERPDHHHPVQPPLAGSRAAIDHAIRFCGERCHRLVISDNSGDPDKSAWLAGLGPDVTIVPDGPPMRPAT